MLLRVINKMASLLGIRNRGAEVRMRTEDDDNVIPLVPMDGLSEAALLMNVLIEKGSVVVNDPRMLQQIILSATFHINASLIAREQPDGSFLVEVGTYD